MWPFLFYSFLSFFFLWNFLLAVSIEGHILFFSNDHREIHVEYSYFHLWTDFEMLINASKCSTSTREPDEKLAEVEHYHHAQTSLNYSGTSTNGHLSTKNNSHLPITASFLYRTLLYMYIWPLQSGHFRTTATFCVPRVAVVGRLHCS